MANTTDFVGAQKANRRNTMVLLVALTALAALVGYGIGWLMESEASSAMPAFSKAGVAAAGLMAAVSIGWSALSLAFGDKLVLAMKSEHRVVYSPWEKAFRLRSGSLRGKPRAVPTLDSLKSLLFSERRLPLAAVGSLEPTTRYYVSVRVTIRPLTAEDLDEVEDWLVGEVKNPEHPERGMPGYLLGIAANLSGLGDRTALSKSETFRPSELEPPTQ